MPEIYGLIEDRFLKKPIEDLPEEERLVAAFDALWACDEFLMNPIVDAIGGSGGQVTYAELGRLLAWAEDVRIVLEVLTDRRAKIHAALHELAIDETPRPVHA